MLSPGRPASHLDSCGHSTTPPGQCGLLTRSLSAQGHPQDVRTLLLLREFLCPRMRPMTGRE